MLSFQKLDVYRAAIDLLSVINRIRAHVPRGHADLVDQLKRATQSIPLNIAEGVGRQSKADKARHYTIARGSAMEVASQLDVMKVDGLLPDQVYGEAILLLERIVSMLTKMIGL
ncbi:MAG TPA: four helix bundle protein [Kofleriaceae bacterium]|jgi:four helix bundle protein